VYKNIKLNNNDNKTTVTVKSYVQVVLVYLQLFRRNSLFK